LGTPNQNIMAPAWMWGEAPTGPRGCFDLEEFTYNSNTASMGLNGAATVQAQIDPTTDFGMRRMFFNLVPDAGVTAYTVKVRARAGSGYALHDDFVIASYVSNAPMLVDWDIAAGEEIYFDLQLVDYAGAGNVAVTCYMEGVKRSIAG